MDLQSLRRLRRLQWQLPLTIAGLLVAVVGVFSWAAYREVHGAALQTTRNRLHDVSDRLASILSQSITARIAETRRVASDSAVILAVTESGNASPAVSDALDQLVGSQALVRSVVLWDTSGALVYRTVAQDTVDALVVTFPTWAVGDSAAISGLKGSDDFVWYEVVVPVSLGDGRPAGYLAQYRELTTSPQGVQLLTDLIGSEAVFMIGEPGGTWTDLISAVPAPAGADRDASDLERYETHDGRSVVGAGLPIGGTSWLVWVEFPLDRVLARPRAFLAQNLPLGLVIVTLGALGGWAVSRRVTKRLGRVTEAARALAGGEHGRRARLNGDDELAELSRAFDQMAASLEQRVADRTAALRASEEQFRTLASTAHDAIVAADDKGRIKYFNPAAERIFQYPAHEVLGQPLTVLMPERFHDPHRRGLVRYVKTGQARVVGRTVELVGRRKSGSEFPLELALASRQLDGEPEFIGILRDITERKEAERVLKQYAAELEVANKELEAFSYSVSHDLRAPLRSIHGFSQAVLEDYGDRLDERGTHYLSRLCAGAQHMGQLIDDLLELSRATRAEMRREQVDLSALAKTIAGDLAASAPDRRADFRIADGLTCEGDQHLLALVLRNLLENAWKFTAKRDQAIIEVGVDEAAVYFVRDNGAGFEMAYVNKLFQPFQRLHGNDDFAGTGIGLALVQRIIHRHRGQVWAEGAVNEGSTFYFALPREQHAKRSVLLKTASSSSSKTIQTTES